MEGISLKRTHRTWRKAIWIGVSASAGMLAAACGGAGGGGGTGTTREVILAANTSLTPWRTGTLDFTVSPALAGDESMSCRIDGGVEQACALDASKGRLSYAGLVPGAHTLTVSVGRGSQKTDTRVAWQIVTPDIVVYGATPSGIVAALAAARAGRSVVLLEPTARLGGMMTGGLAKSDVGSADVPPLGGLTDEFFVRTRQREVETGACSGGNPCPTLYDFEPHVAEHVFSNMLSEQPLISVQRSLPLIEVSREDGRLKSILTARGDISGEVFVDASYEGDLMVAAGVSYTSGREPRQSVADGIPLGDVEDDAGFSEYRRPQGVNVDPYVVPGQASSGLIALVEPPPVPTPPLGSGDDRLMAYNYRICVTDDPSNRVPFDRPDDFDVTLYEGSARVALAVAAAGRLPPEDLYFNPHPTVRSKDRRYYKYDLNGGPAFSTDVSGLGWNQAYPTATAKQRADIAAAYRSYGRGLLYAWRTDPRFGTLNAKVEKFGYCADEFIDNQHWPHALYVRESRRMRGDYVMNQNDVAHNGRRPTVTDSIGMGSYGMDSHFRRLTTTTINGRDLIVTEGFGVIHPQGDPRYRVPYRILLPRRAEAGNLLNPGTPSSTSLAYRSLRMEPTLMVLGQAAGTAAAMAVEFSAAVQDINVSELRARLMRAGQIIE